MFPSIIFHSDCASKILYGFLIHVCYMSHPSIIVYLATIILNQSLKGANLRALKYSEFHIFSMLTSCIFPLHVVLKFPN